MDFSLSDDQRAFQDAARAFARHELTPHAAHWDEQSIFPRDTIARAGELGFCGLYTPETYGGLGLSRLDAAIVFEELAAGCTSTTAYITIHNMVSWMFATWAQPEVAERWAPFLVSGEKLGSYCLTEPNAGSDAANLRTRAERRSDRYVLNGSKMFISGAGETDLLLVMARTGEAGPKGISAFAVPADLPGIHYGKKEHPTLSSLINDFDLFSSCSKTLKAALTTSLTELYLPVAICSLMNFSKYSPNNMEVFRAMTFLSNIPRIGICCK